MVWIILLIFTILIAVILPGTVIAYANFKPRIGNFEKACEKEKSLYRISDKNINNIRSQEVYIQSPSGNEVAALFIPADNNNKAIILVHNSPYTMYGNSKYIEMFSKRGYNILIYNYCLQWQQKEASVPMASKKGLI